MVDGRCGVRRDAGDVIGGAERGVAGCASETSAVRGRREVTPLVVVHAVRAWQLDVTLRRRRVTQTIAHREQVVVAKRLGRLKINQTKFNI